MTAAAPTWKRIYQALRDDITGGRYQLGQQLPTIPELMRQWGVSDTPVRDAETVLQAEGLIKVRRGAGAFVVSLRPTADLAAEVADLREQVRALQAAFDDHVRVHLPQVDAGPADTV